MNQGSDLFFDLGKRRRRISFLLSFLVFDVGSAVSEVVINSRQMKGKSALFLQKILGCAFHEKQESLRKTFSSVERKKSNILFPWQ